MVEFPDPDDAADSFDFDQGEKGMTERTHKTFQAHYRTQLEPSGLIDDTIAEIERVYRADPRAVVGCSGGKDSLVLLCLAEQSSADHRALHWDWGARLVPRDMEREIVTILREYTPDKRLFVASRSCPTFRPYSDHDTFQRGLHTHDGITETDGSLNRLAGSLARADDLGRQLVGLRKGESGSRGRKLDATGLYGESLGRPAAFPIRDWSARDVWAYLVANDITYPSYYDRVAHATGDGGPRDYENARLATVHDPEFENYSADGLAAWRDHDVRG